MHASICPRICGLLRHCKCHQMKVLYTPDHFEIMYFTIKIVNLRTMSQGGFSNISCSIVCIVFSVSATDIGDPIGVPSFCW